MLFRSANASTLSSYRFADAAPQTPVVISPAVATLQTAACWVAVTPDGRFAYTTNTGSGSISLFRIARDGRITLAQSVGTAGSGPIDAFVSADGRRLHVLQAPLRSIASFRIAGDGALAAAGVTGGLPAGSVGLAAN